jgi:hypothetical protein
MAQNGLGGGVVNLLTTLHFNNCRRIVHLGHIDDDLACRLLRIARFA